MSLTDAQFIAWLKSPARKPCVLVEAVARVAGVETTRYISNTGYTTGAADTPANTTYHAKLTAGGQITEKLALDNTGAGLSFGDLELDNTQGDLDTWLADIWTNRSVKMYVGDQRWVRADFRLVFDGVAQDLTSTARNVLNLQMRDKLQRLNTAVTDTKLGGATTNADRLLPLCFGEVHNVEPLLVDPATLKYQVHQGAIESIIEVRDNGVPVSFTATLGAGTFVLLAQPAGQITCSVQGDKPSGVYSNTVSKLVQRLATGYGKTPLVSGDLDATQLASFDAANTQPVGLYLPDPDNVLAVCQALAASVGAQVVISSTGLLRLLKIDLAGTSPTAIAAANMEGMSLQVAERIPVVAAVKLGYCRNYTVQKNLQTGIPQVDKVLFEQEWLTSTATDATVATTYSLPVDVDEVDTMLQVKADADAETARRLAIWKVQRTVFQYLGMAELLLEALGGYQTITHPRFNLSGGKTGQTVGVVRDWIKANVQILELV